MTDGEMGVEVIGIDPTCRHLEGLGREIILGILGRALAAAAVPIVQEIQALTPEREAGERDENDVPLVDSIRTDIMLKRDGSGGTAQIGFGKQGWKALLVEYGHRMIGHAPEKKPLTGSLTPGGIVQPIPFMRTGLDIAEDEAIERFVQSIQASLAEVEANGTLRGGEVLGEVI